MAAVQIPGRRETLTLDAVPTAVAEARRWVRRVASARLAPEQQENLQLVMSEVVTNALVHGAPGERIDVAVTPKERFLCVQVSDDGPGLAPRPGATQPDDHGGFGLFFVEQLTRRWGVTRENRRTRVWFELDYVTPA